VPRERGRHRRVEPEDVVVDLPFDEELVDESPLHRLGISFRGRRGEAGGRDVDPLPGGEDIEPRLVAFERCPVAVAVRGLFDVEDAPLARAPGQ
jgi:hypothetical protein